MGLVELQWIQSYMEDQNQPKGLRVLCRAWSTFDGLEYLGELSVLKKA